MTGLDVSFGPWGESIAEQVMAARAAEDAGFERVWVAELHRSAFVPTTAMAAATSRIGIGTGIAWAFARSEMTTALATLDLDDLSDGRFVLGLGTGVKRLIEDWHHAVFGSPADHARESIELIRKIIATAHTGERIKTEGEWVSVDIRGYERPFLPRRTEVPVYLAAVGPVMTRLAGEIADGWLAHELGSPAYVREKILPNLEEGARRAGRDRTSVRRIVSACCVPYHDSKQAKRWAAGLVAFYASVRTYEDFFDFHGFLSEAKAVQEAFRAGDRAAMVSAVPDEMVDAFTFAGTPDEVRGRLSGYEGVADGIKLTPPTHDVDPEVTRLAQSAILELFAT